MKRALIIAVSILWALGTTLSINSGDVQAQENIKPKLPSGMYIGDIDGDGLEDMIRAQGNRISVFKTNFEQNLILQKQLDKPINRLVLGDFTTSGREHGRDQVCAILVDNALQCYASSNNHRDLWWWFTQPSFIADNDEPLVGDFDGDGAEDVLVYTPSSGQIKMYTRLAGSFFFQLMPNFTLGNLSGIDRRNKELFVGEFGGVAGRDDLLVVDPRHGQVLRYDAVTDNQGNKTFWWAFTTASIIRNGETLSVANIDGGSRDGIVLAKNGAYRFFAVEYDNGNLKSVPSVHPGNLTNIGGVQPFFGRFAKFDNEPGASRDDILLIRESTRQLLQIDARYYAQNRQSTYWWAYTTSLPSLAVGCEYGSNGEIGWVRCP